MKGIFGASAPHIPAICSAKARGRIARHNMGHANIDVTQNVYGKSAGCLAKFKVRGLRDQAARWIMSACSRRPVLLNSCIGRRSTNVQFESGDMDDRKQHVD
jgi:hypothetical protein